jgi:hypothetical protein
VWAVFELLRRYSRWIDAGFLVFWLVLFAVSVVSRSWFWACIAGIWTFREAFGLARPGKHDEDVDDTAAEPVLRTSVDPPGRP